MFPELLYRLQPGEEDRGMEWLTPHFAIASQSTAGTSVEAFADMPNDRYFLLQSAAALADPGAGQIVTRLNIQLQREFISITSIAAVLAYHGGVSGVADRDHGLAWSGSLLVPPRYRILANANFNAGAVANLVLLDIAGLFIPVGNIQRVR